jgi:hypothetical protein
MSDEPGWSTEEERMALGSARFTDFIEAQSQVHAESMALTLSLGFAGSHDYSDEALEAIERDCRDLITAAHALAHLGRRYAREFRAQRVRAERRR